jgi:hypothetical protein
MSVSMFIMYEWVGEWQQKTAPVGLQLNIPAIGTGRTRLVKGIDFRRRQQKASHLPAKALN